MSRNIKTWGEDLNNKGGHTRTYANIQKKIGLLKFWGLIINTFLSKRGIYAISNKM